jgi:ATP-dependent Clp protease ATP-binding subunit ClpA
MTISRRVLFGKLNSTLFRTLESATAFAKLRGNPYVELTHWLHQIWQLNDSDLHRILRHHHVDAKVLDKDMAMALAALPADSTSLIDFSHHVGSAVEKAWVLSSLEFNEDRIRGSQLLAAMVQTPELRSVLLGVSGAFQKIPVDALGQSLSGIFVGSPEDREDAHGGPGVKPSWSSLRRKTPLRKAETSASSASPRSRHEESPRWQISRIRRSGGRRSWHSYSAFTHCVRQVQAMLRKRQSDRRPPRN